MTARPFRLVATVASEDEPHATVQARAGYTGSATAEHWSADFDVLAQQRSAAPPMPCRPRRIRAWPLMRRVP